MTSNCYLVIDEESKHCICIDPGSEQSECEISFIDGHNLELDYIILTHEHTDHTWGVNALLRHYPPAKVICSEPCKNALPNEAKAYFQLYYDDPTYSYNVDRVDYTTQDLNWHQNWRGREIAFIPTPGHSPGSICIEIEGIIYGGDTVMPFKPFIKKRNGGSIKDYRSSLLFLKENYGTDAMIYPGHGEKMTLGELLPFYNNILDSDID